MTLTRSKYKKLREPDARMLKPGYNNKKLGGTVKTGPLKNAVLYSLTLEERTTCPTACAMWDACYGNNMPFAYRYDHTHPEFLVVLSEALSELCSTHKSVLVRLHVLGDFFSEDYVNFWEQAMDEHPELHIFGYTAHDPHSPIGQAIHKMTLAHGWRRSAIRFSGHEGPRGAVVGKPGAGFTCPEQLGKVKTCARCAACWNGEDLVNFIEH